MHECILFINGQVVARANGNWVRPNEIQLLQHIGAADNVNRMLIDNVNFRVIEHVDFVFLVQPDPIPEH